MISYGNILFYYIGRQSEDETMLNRPSDSELPPVRPGSPTNTEKDILRYYYYIHNGIDTGVKFISFVKYFLASS